MALYLAYSFWNRGLGQLGNVHPYTSFYLYFCFELKHRKQALFDKM